MANEDKRIIIYPDYINSKKTVAQGRRIPADAAVEWPSIPEMLDACMKGMQLEAQFEPKRYPRNWCVEPGREECWGRIRVQLRKDDGSPVNADVPTRRELMVRMAELVKRHPDRHKKKAEASSSSGTPGSSSKAGGGKKKKGKK